MWARGVSILFLVTLVSFTSLAQGEGPCIQKLERAQDEFEVGHFYAIAPLLNECLNNGFTREQQIQAYYLLTRTYLFLDKLDSADYAYLQILKINPEYTVDAENDPIDVVYLSQNFTTSPIISLKVEAGTSFSSVNVVHNYGVDNTDLSNEFYETGWGAQAGIGAELHFSNSLSVEFGPKVALKTNRYSNLLWDGDLQTKRESNFVLDLPMYLRYTFKGNQIRPYVFAGGAFNLIFASSSKNILENVTDDAVTPTEGPNINNRRSRSFVNRSLLFGVGGMYKIGFNYLHANVSYAPGLTLLNNRDRRYLEDDRHYNDANLWLYSYVDDDFRFNSFFINIGYTRPLYFARKKSKFTLRNWFEKFSKKKE